MTAPAHSGDEETPELEPVTTTRLSTREIPVVTPDDLASTPADTPSPTRARMPREILILVVAAFVIAVGYGVITPVLPQYARSFDVGISAASAVVSAFALMRLVFAPAGGALVNRFGERPTYVAGLLVTAASTAAAAFAQDFTQLIVFRGLGGIGSVMFTVSAMGLLVRLSPPGARGKASSLYGSAFLLGGVLGPTLGSLLAVYGYRVPFLAYAGALVVAALFAAVMLAGARLRSVDPAREKPPITLTQAWADSAFRAALVGAFSHGWANFGARLSLIPLFIAALPAVPDSVVGVVFTVYAAGNVLGLTVSGRLTDRIGRRPPMILGFLLAGAGTLVLAAWANPWWFAAASAIAGAGAGLLTPALQVVVADVIGNNRSGGTPLSVFQMAQDIGVILAPVATGAVATLWGFGWAFVTAGIPLLVGALAVGLGRETVADAIGEDTHAVGAAVENSAGGGGAMG